MSNEPKAGMSIDPEMLAAYIDKRLSPEQRAEVEAQLAGDPDSYALLVETMKAQDALGGQPKPARATIPTWVIAAIATAAMVSIVVWTTPSILQRARGDDAEQRLASLVAAAGSERFVDARLSGGFKFGPRRGETRGAEADAPLALLAAAEALRAAAAAEPNAANLRGKGIADLLLHRYDAAIDSLQQALALDPNSAATLNDLAVAHFARAASRGRDDLVDALALIDRAVAIDPSFVEARFNAALIAQALALPRAGQDWAAYLSVERNADWRAEAERLRVESRR